MIDKLEQSIEIVPVEEGVELVDVMRGAARWSLNVLDHGIAALLDVMPRLVPKGSTADMVIAQAARVSYGAGTTKLSKDKDLIRYLLRHFHTTPFEMVECKFHVRMPIFVAGQWLRHRTASINMYSARYSEVPDRFYIPTVVRQQSATNNQGGDDPVDEATAAEFIAFLEASCQAQHRAYTKALAQGVSREQARMLLPQNVYTEFYWKVDLHNLFHFLGLRMDGHAQQEIREFANAVFALIRGIVPVASQAFMDYRFGAVQFTLPEQVALKTGVLMPNKREQTEFLEKCKHVDGVHWPPLFVDVS